MNNKLRILNRNIANVCVIGDIHSSPNELRSVIAQSRERGINKFLSLGDIFDRGDGPNDVIDIILELLNAGELEIILGNHDWKFIRYFSGQKVSIADEQVETLRKLTQKSIDAFMGIFADLPVAIYDPVKKIFISHAAGGRPADILGRDFQKSREHNFASYENYINDTSDKLIEKKYAANLLYGITNNKIDGNGRPIRLPITDDVNDDLEGWQYFFGHIHSNNLFPEGNRRVICLDYSCGEPPHGKLAGLIINDMSNVSEENLILSK